MIKFDNPEMYGETKIVSDPDAFPGWVVLAVWTVPDDTVHTDNHYENGNYVQKSIPIRHEHTCVLIGRHFDDSLADAIERAKQAGNEKDEAVEQAKSAQNLVLKLKNKLGHDKNWSKEVDDLRERIVQLLDLKNKLERDMGIIRKEIGDARVREILKDAI